MDIKTELHNLKTMVLTESHISDEAKKKIADKINQIQKGVVMNYIPCCTSEAEQLSCGRNISTCVFYKDGGKCSNLEYRRDQTT